MGRSMIETVMGAVVLAVATMFVVFVYNERTVASGDGYDVVAKFDDVAGVAAGSDVRIGGIKVGTVLSSSLDPQSYRPVLALHVRNDVKVPSDTVAAIVSEGLLGGKYVELQPGGDEQMLKAGDEILYTQSSVNLEEMIGKFVFSGGGVDSGAEAPAPEPEGTLN